MTVDILIASFVIAGLVIIALVVLYVLHNDKQWSIDVDEHDPDHKPLMRYINMTDDELSRMAMWHSPDTLVGELVRRFDSARMDADELEAKYNKLLNDHLEE